MLGLGTSFLAAAADELWSGNSVQFVVLMVLCAGCVYHVATDS